ncbi:MAG: hypothetical protein WCV84_02170 [Patescibacteria group bacterium]
MTCPKQYLGDDAEFVGTPVKEYDYLKDFVKKEKTLVDGVEQEVERKVKYRVYVTVLNFPLNPLGRLVPCRIRIKPKVKFSLNEPQGETRGHFAAKVGGNVDLHVFDSEVDLCNRGETSELIAFVEVRARVVAVPERGERTNTYFYVNAECGGEPPKDPTHELVITGQGEPDPDADVAFGPGTGEGGGQGIISLVPCAAMDARRAAKAQR